MNAHPRLRRTFAAALFFLVSVTGFSAPEKKAPVVQTKASQAATTPARALELLEEGNGRFVSGKTTRRDLPAKVRMTAADQFPFAAIVSCMDSRAPAEILFDRTIGDFFSLRVAGNIVDSDFLGSLEYAAKVTGSKLIVILGHTGCGAVKGA